MDAIDEYVAKYAENECGWTEKGRIHLERGEYTQGLVATKQSLDLNPYNTHAWNNLGVLLNRTNAPIAEVKTAFANALHFDPFNTAAMMNLIGPLVLHKEYSEAATLTSRALKLRPAKPLVLQKAEALLKELFDERDLVVAETLLSGWTDARPADADAWHNLGLISIDKGNLDQAIECFNRVHDLSPEDNFAVVQLAKLYFQRKRSRECLLYCDKLLELGHEPVLAVSLKSRVLNFVSGYAQALNFIQPYLDRNPENDVLWVVLSEIHEYRDNYESAIEALRIAKGILERSNGDHTQDNLEFVEKKLQQLSAVS